MASSLLVVGATRPSVRGGREAGSGSKRRGWEDVGLGGRGVGRNGKEVEGEERREE